MDFADRDRPIASEEEERVRDSGDAETFTDHVPKVLRDCRGATIGVEERVLHLFVSGKDEVDVVTPEAKGRLAEIASEEAADAAVPGADPGDDAITAVKLLL